MDLGNPGTPGTTSTVGPSGVAYAAIAPVSVTTATTLSSTFDAQLQGIGPYNASQYAVSGDGSLNLNHQVLSIGYINGYLPAIGDRITLVSNTTGNAGAVSGHFDNASGQELDNGAEVYATDGNGNVITDSSGQPIYFRIFYPGGGIGPDGGTTDNQNVYLVRQAPVTILGTGMPGSTGLFDSSGNPLLDLRYDAGDPTVYTYQTVDQNGKPATASYHYQDDGSGAQRSLISEITVTFSGIVDNIDPSQLSLYTSDNSALGVGLQVAGERVVGEDTVATFTFLPDTSGNNLTRQRRLEEVVIQTNSNGSPLLDADGNPLAALDPNTGLPLQLDTHGRPIYLNPDGTQETPARCRRTSSPTTCWRTRTIGRSRFPPVE